MPGDPIAMAACQVARGGVWPGMSVPPVAGPVVGNGSMDVGEGESRRHGGVRR